MAWTRRSSPWMLVNAMCQGTQVAEYESGRSQEKAIFATSLALGLQEGRLVFKWNREDANNHPGVRSHEVELLGGAEKEMEIGLRELCQVLGADQLQGLVLATG